MKDPYVNIDVEQKLKLKLQKLMKDSNAELWKFI